MSHRFLAWTTLSAACGLHIYLVAKGCILFLELDAVLLPMWLHSFSSYLFAHYLLLPYYFPIFIIALLGLATILGCAFLGFRRKSGWTLALVVDLCLALPSLALIGMFKYHHATLQNSPEILLFFLASLHILVLCSPPVRTLIFPKPETQDINHESFLPITSAR